MNCIETKDGIEALLDNELDDIRKSAIEHHLLACTSCREERDRIAALSSLLQTSRVPVPSAGFDKRVMQSFRNHHAPPRPFRSVGFARLGATFAALVLLAVALWTAFKIGETTATTVFVTSPEVLEYTTTAGAEAPIRTVVVKVPVVKEKTITRAVYLKEKKTANVRAGSAFKSNATGYVSTVAENGFFTDLSLKGFQPSPEINAQIIKGVKENEK